MWYSTIQHEPALRFALQFQLVAAGVLWLVCQVAFPSLRIEPEPSVVKPGLVRSDDRLGFVPGLRLIWETPRRTPTILLIVAGALANGECKDVVDCWRLICQIPKLLDRGVAPSSRTLGYLMNPLSTSCRRALPSVGLVFLAHSRFTITEPPWRSALLGCPCQGHQPAFDHSA